MTIEIVDLPIENGDFHSYVSLPEGMSADGWWRSQKKKSSVLKLTHKGIPVRCRLENTACGWHLKPLTFEVHGQGLKVRCGS